MNTGYPIEENIACESKWFVGWFYLNNQSRTENLHKSLMTMVEKCHTYGIKNVFISGLVYATGMDLSILES